MVGEKEKPLKQLHLFQLRQIRRGRGDTESLVLGLYTKLNEINPKNLLS